jgi:NTP pyrophosphatase (non-canonical NTP hydrolase)
MKKINDIAVYQQLASRTCPDLGSEEQNIKHMHMGIITEVGEAIDVIKKFIAYGKPLDIINIGEELADIIWYKANECRITSHIWTQEEFDVACSDLDAFMLIEKMQVTAENVDESIASILPFMYLVEEGESGLKSIAVLNTAVNFYGLDLFQLLTNNINKLLVRYPDKFTNEAALNRDLEAERKELEK